MDKYIVGGVTVIDNNKKIVVSKNNDMSIIYSNAVNINSNYFDFQITFAQQTFDQDIININEICKVFMSPQHVKTFRDLLIDQVKIYEMNNGEINCPSKILQEVSVTNE